MDRAEADRLVEGLPNYKDKTDIWLLHEYLWVDMYGGREGNESAKNELQKRGYLFDENGCIKGFSNI